MSLQRGQRAIGVERHNRWRIDCLRKSALAEKSEVSLIEFAAYVNYLFLWLLAQNIKTALIQLQIFFNQKKNSNPLLQILDLKDYHLSFV